MDFKIFLKKIKKDLLGERSTDIALRYAPIIYQIKKDFLLDEKILEVGSGSFGITPYLKREIVGLDIFFDALGPKYLKQVLYDGGIFPFRDDEFDLVFSVDSLEHVIPEKRKQYIEEMFRVSKKAVLILVPTGEKAYKHDKRLGRYFLKYNNKQDQYIEEHIYNGLPSESEMMEIFNDIIIKNDGNFILVKKIKMLNINFREFLMVCKIKNNFFFNFLYYVALILVPFWRFLNWGDCYRNFFYFKIK